MVVGFTILFSFLALSQVVFAVQPVQPSSANCTWKFITQPLSHFERGNKGTYQQRLCIYDGYYQPNTGAPIFLYTGNESPVDEYVNNTGLMWNLAEKMSALIIFAEHRYFGESVPSIKGVKDCVAYLTSQEALADYATLTNIIRHDSKTWGTSEETAIVAFGGSYGGMLASWMRTQYPSAIDGAIAASAPIWGFPMDNCPWDGSAKAVAYATSSQAGSSQYCSSNLKFSYIFLSDIGKTSWGRDFLSQQLNLCSPLKNTADINTLLNYLQSPLFNLAEGSYPFPSNYITYALTGESESKLPPWAMTVMCESVDKDFGVKVVDGSEEEVLFTLSDSTGKLQVKVNWDQTNNNGYTENDVLQSSAVIDLMRGALQGIQVWYNVSQSLPACYDWEGINTKNKLTAKVNPLKEGTRRFGKQLPSVSSLKEISEKKVSTPVDGVCTAEDSALDAGTAWNILTCNEGINLVNWRIQGVGTEKLYWPPNVPRGFDTNSLVNGSLEYCDYYKFIGLYGLPSEHDDWAFWIDTVYGGTRFDRYATNIVFTNGDLDPWMPAGVNMASNTVDQTGKVAAVGKEDSEEIVSVLIKQGGHHLDLFFPTDSDPENVK